MQHSVTDGAGESLGDFDIALVSLPRDDVNRHREFAQSRPHRLHTANREGGQSSGEVTWAVLENFATRRQIHLRPINPKQVSVQPLIRK